MRKDLSKWLDKKAGEYGVRALFTVSLGTVFWPLLPVGIAYTGAALAAAAAAKVVRPWS